MINVTRINLHDGVVILPADGEYDDTVALEDAGFYARRHGEVLMEIHDHEVVVRAGTVNTTRCTQCHRSHTLSFGTGERLLCLRCARALLSALPTLPLRPYATVHDDRLERASAPHDLAH